MTYIRMFTFHFYPTQLVSVSWLHSRRSQWSPVSSWLLCFSVSSVSSVSITATMIYNPYKHKQCIVISQFGCSSGKNSNSANIDECGRWGSWNKGEGGGVLCALLFSQLFFLDMHENTIGSPARTMELPLKRGARGCNAIVLLLYSYYDNKYF